MGAWGIGIFEGDTPYDMIAELSEIAGRELYFFKTLPDMKQAAVDFDSGLTDKVRSTIKGDKSNMVFFAALVMNAGGKMSEEHKKEIEGIVGTEVGPMPGTKEFDEVSYSGKQYIMGQGQVVLALKEYKNDGEPYDFKNLGLMDMMSFGMNYREEWQAYQWGGPFPPSIAKKTAEYEAKKAAEAEAAAGGSGGGTGAAAVPKVEEEETL